MKKLLIFIFALLFILPAMAELITVSGTIKDDLGPLVGATVLVSGTSTGAATDTDGKFRIPNVASDAKIDISYIGYKKQTLSATDINASTPISLKEDAFEAGEVTVTGKYTPKPCTTDQLPTNAASGMTKLPPEGQSGLLCVIDKCNSGYDLDAEQNQCITISGPCTKLPSHATSGTRAWDAVKNKENCIISKCNTGFDLKDNKCVSVSGPCDKNQLPENAITGSRVRRNNTEICIPDTCIDGYEVLDEKCAIIAGQCQKKSLPRNAASGTRAWDTETKQEICNADSCNDGYQLVGGKCESELSEQESANKASELRDNAAAMKEKENSIANKLLGTAAIGAGGIGVSQMLAAGAEKNADADAERDMKAYLETFRCDFGQGRNIRGGAKDLVLPGGNELMPLYTEYKALAAELKTIKESLGMTPGIESETIFDKADNGLYDNETIERQSGAYTSLSRALSDAASADSAALADQKSDTARKSQTGMIVAGVGIAGGLVGNLAINSGKNVAQESSDQINNKYKSGLNAAADKNNAPGKSSTTTPAATSDKNNATDTPTAPTPAAESTK